MRVLFDCGTPFSIAHGGQASQILQTRAGLLSLGIDCDFLRWWEEEQPADILHFFARPSEFYASFAKKSGKRLVISELLTGQGSWSPLRRLPNQTVVHASRITGRKIGSRLGWGAYRLADAILALTPWEARLLTELYDAPPERIHVVPNGVEREFLEGPTPCATARENYLVCVATITERKRIVDLARAANLAKVPVWIIGKPYSETDPYFLRFLEIARSAGSTVHYEGPVNDRTRLAKIYARARGFVLVSAMESQSLSALEAAACRCPLLLADLPWARCSFGTSARYIPISSNPVTTSQALLEFHQDAPALSPPPMPPGWPDVARLIADIYRNVLAA